MKLSKHARKVLDRTMEIEWLAEEERREVEELIRMMPDDRVLLYKNVDSNPVGDLPRYSIQIRLQHLLMFSSFLILAFTGLPVHYHESFWAKPFNDFLGGIYVTRVIHRAMAAVFIFSGVYHVVTIVFDTLYKISRKRFDWHRTMIPSFKDLVDFKEDFLYFLGRRDQRPEMEKFMYKQKLHYFAAVFGNTVMMVTGATFLFPDIIAKFSIAPHYVQSITRLAHPHEALLALIVIAFWHWYNVHFAPGRFPMQWTFLTGKLTREHQIEEHFLEYLRQLVEIPSERAYLRELLTKKKLAAVEASRGGESA
ncbi:MAG TPA: hypothetical protein ENJ37_09555, partial [Deltaproteobacteria bacterium]|nr:hypothetical protein [Deltaproteobacteria bacterium]